MCKYTNCIKLSENSEKLLIFYALWGIIISESEVRKVEDVQYILETIKDLLEILVLVLTAHKLTKEQKKSNKSKKRGR